MTNFDKTFWSITADSYKTDKVYKIANNVISSTASSKSYIKIVIHIDGETTVSEGNGSESNPYIIKTA